MIDWIALCEAVRERLASRGASATGMVGVTMVHALDAAAAELRRQRDAAQSDADVDAVEHSDSCWAHGWQHYPCLLAHRTALQAKLDDAADEYEHSHRERMNAGKALERTERERDEARTERDRLAGSLAVCGVIAREGDGTCLPEYETDAVTAVRRLRAERDDARARLAELEPLVATVVERYRHCSREGLAASVADSEVSALVLHERRRAKEKADGK